MSGETIKTQLDNWYATGNSKNFLNHLIKAYLPLNKTVKVSTLGKGRMVCVLTNKRLMAFDEIKGKQNDEFTTSLSVDLSDAIAQDAEPKALTKSMNGRYLGFTGDKTTTFISYEGLKALVKWVNGKVAENDKHITWLVS